MNTTTFSVPRTGAPETFTLRKGTPQEVTVTVTPGNPYDSLGDIFLALIMDIKDLQEEVKQLRNKE